MRDEKKSYKLGVTGGIGSGKSTVCKVFSTLGISVFSSDPEAQKIMNTDSEIIKKINSIAGRNMYPGGTLDRQALAAIIFNNKQLLEEVNSIVHPAVAVLFKQWMLNQSSPYVIMESAILFESGASKNVDRIATVVAPEEERISRVMERNHLTREQVMERIRNQMNDESRIRLSHYVIDNSENEMIIPSILKIHEDLLSFIKLQN
jgi:dephospho-CoA kinase